MRRMKFLHLMVSLPGRLEQIEPLATHVAPSLLKLLRRGRPLQPAAGYTATLCDAFSVKQQQDWPLAPLCAAAEGLDAKGYWLRLDPVHLEVGMGGLLMRSPDNLNLTLTEAHALIADINRHWQHERLSLQAVSPTRWYLRSDEAPNLRTTPIDQMIGEYLTPGLPRGADARLYLKLINDVQMLMHTHPVNLARELAGQLAINGLWLWGGGVLPAYKPNEVESKTIQTPFDLVAADDFETLAMARWAGCRQTASPDSLSTLKQSHRALAALSTPGANIQDDLESRLTELEQNWFRPALSQLTRGGIGQLRLDLIGQRSVTLSPAHAWRFWL